MNDVAIRVTGLGKQYRIGGVQEPYKTLRGSLTGLARAPVRLLRRSAAPTRSTFWALKDVSFEVKQGEVLGIIGRNGAGKSTLLKILSSITEPTTGQVEICGQVASLLEVGTGFHPELTGRENIFLNGAILGMRREYIQRRFDEIVAFAEVEQFIDTPVKHYSSGMYLRLAFAVAAHLEPDILVVDEVLAVGDAEFQKKCLGMMSEVARGGRTVLFVSHNLAAIRNLCPRAILLQRGQIICDDTATSCLSQYMTENGNGRVSLWQRDEQSIAGVLLISRVKATLLAEQPNHILEVEVKLVSKESHRPAFVALDVLDSTGIAIMQAAPVVEGFIKDSHSEHVVRLGVNLPPLIPGRYVVTVWTGSHYTETLDLIRECVSFEIDQSPTRNRTFPHGADHGYIVPDTTLEYVPMTGILPE